MTTVERLRRRDLDPFAWIDNAFGPLSATPLTWPFGTQHTLRVEEKERDQEYVVRVEVPGLDPAQDIHVEVTDGVLEIRAERHQEDGTADRSEFRYGSFLRRLVLPPSADEEAVRASYVNGILEVHVALPERRPPVRRTIAIAHENGHENSHENGHENGRPDDRGAPVESGG